jgi:peroxiredoxin
LRERLAAIKELNAEVWAVDPHEQWAAKFLMKDVAPEGVELRYPLLMDPTFQVSSLYGVAFQMRIHTEWSNRPATFIIDRDGIVQLAHRGQRFNDRPRVDDIIKQLREISPGQKP